MISTEQADDLLEYLREQLDAHGFQSVNDEIHIRFKEAIDNENEELLLSDRINMLRWYITNVNEIFISISNNRVIEESIEKINKNLDSESYKIEDILLYSTDEDDKEVFDLKTLPNYNKITVVFSSILETIFRN